MFLSENILGGYKRAKLAKLPHFLVCFEQVTEPFLELHFLAHKIRLMALLTSQKLLTIEKGIFSDCDQD